MPAAASPQDANQRPGEGCKPGPSGIEITLWEAWRPFVVTGGSVISFEWLYAPTRFAEAQGQIGWYREISILVPNWDGVFLRFGTKRCLCTVSVEETFNQQGV